MLRTIIKLVGFFLGAYLLAFVILFDPLSFPCRTSSQWIGPKLRFDDAYVDIGKVLEYQKEVGLEYRVFSPLCRIWLAIAGME